MRFYLVIILAFYGLSASGQGENNMWVFGFRAGLDFNGGTVTSYQPAITGGNSEACAAVSDATGQLLFYTNGSIVWDRSHNRMPGGNTLHGRPVSSLTESAQHGAQIVPVIGEPDKYYIFSLTEWEAHASGYGGRLFYSVVDMALNGGMGDIDPARKWMPLDFNLTEKMIAVPGADCNIWLLVHDLDTNLFKAYEISAGGVNHTPVRSYTGFVGSLPGTAGNNNTIKNRWWNVGQISVSPDRTKLAAAYLAPGYAEVYDFDVSSGQVSNAFVLDTILQLSGGNSFCGVSFSGDNTKLYSSGAREVGNQSNNNRYIYQYNMLAGGGTAGIRASRTLVGNCGINSHLRRGPDGKIYFLHNSSTDSIGVIAAPDQPVPACQYRSRELMLVSGSYSQFTLGNDYVMPLPPDTMHHRHPETLLCQGTTLELVGRPGFSGYLWEDGTTDSLRIIDTAGSYYVLNIDSCHSWVDTFVVRYRQVDSVFHRIDTFICASGTLELRTATDVASWDDGSSDSVMVVSQPGVYYAGYWLPQACTYYVDTFYVSLIDLSFDLGNDTIICGDKSFLLQPAIPVVGAAYKWQDGSTGDSFVVTTSGRYYLEMSRGACMAKDSIDVRFIDLRPDLGNDTSVCVSDLGSYQLRADIPEHAVAIWPDGSHGDLYMVNDPGIYWLSFQQDGCIASDTVVINTEICTCSPVLPTAFTPNGDGKNDLFRLIYEPGCMINEFSLRVYDRWGRMIYTTNDPASGWDGQVAGIAADAGTYMYMASFTAGTREEHRTLKGDVTLVR